MNKSYIYLYVYNLISFLNLIIFFFLLYEIKILTQNYTRSGLNDFAIIIIIFFFLAISTINHLYVKNKLEIRELIKGKKENEINEELLIRIAKDINLIWKGLILFMCFAILYTFYLLMQMLTSVT